jgi:hypothetical protein
MKPYKMVFNRLVEEIKCTFDLTKRNGKESQGSETKEEVGKLDGSKAQFIRFGARSRARDLQLTRRWDERRVSNEGHFFGGVHIFKWRKAGCFLDRRLPKLALLAQIFGGFLGNGRTKDGGALEQDDEPTSEGEPLTALFDIVILRVLLLVLVLV